MLRHLGTVIHAAAVLAASGASDIEIGGRIDDIWHHLDFGSVWYSAKQREQAERMVRKFLDWHAANPRELVAVEQSLQVQIGQVQITGRVDRLERDDQSRAVVVDLKTGSSAPARRTWAATRSSACTSSRCCSARSSGWGSPIRAVPSSPGRQGRAHRTGRIQPQRALGDDDDPAWAKDLVETVAAGMAGPVFQARVNPGCRTCPVASCCPVNDSGTQVQP